MRIVDLAGHEWWNPVADISAAATGISGAASNVASAVSNAWNSLPPEVQTGIIVGAAVGVTIAAAASCGLLAPAAAAVDASALGTVGLGAIATAGVGAATEAAPDIESGMTTEITPSLSREGISLASIAEDFPIRQLSGFLGEEFTNAQTGDVNNGMLAEKLGENSMAIVTEAGETIPDSLDYSFGSPPVAGYVRVGGYFSWAEYDKIAAAVDSGATRPGIIYALESPVTGAMGPGELMEKAFGYLGFSIVKIPGPWWRF